MLDKVSLKDQEIENLKNLAHIMDRAFTIPGTNIRMGVDSILGLLPVIGDTLSVAVSGYIFTFAKRAGVPWYKRAHMIWNIFVDWLIGIIPFIGDIFDIGFKANSKNVDIIVAHHEAQKNHDVIDGTYTNIS